MTFHKPSRTCRACQEAGTELHGVLFRELSTRPDSTPPCCRDMPMVQAMVAAVAAGDYSACHTKQQYLPRQPPRPLRLRMAVEQVEQLRGQVPGGRQRAASAYDGGARLWEPWHWSLLCFCRNLLAGQPIVATQRARALVRAQTTTIMMRVI